MPEIDDEVLVAFDQGDFQSSVHRRLPVGMESTNRLKQSKNRVSSRRADTRCRFEDGDPNESNPQSNQATPSRSTIPPAPRK